MCVLMLILLSTAPPLNPCVYLGQRFPNGGLRPGIGPRKQTAGSPKYSKLIFNFIIMSRVSS